jgi:hypothetical protein
LLIEILLNYFSGKCEALLRATLGSPNGCIVLDTPFDILFEAHVTAPFEIKSITVQLIKVWKHRLAKDDKKQTQRRELKVASVHKPGNYRIWIVFVDRYFV